MKAQRCKPKPDAYERVKIGFEKLKLKWNKMKAQRLKPKLDKNGRTPDQKIRFEKYHRLRKLLPTRISLPLDGILCAASNAFHLDVFRLEKQIPNYNGDECTYKDKPNYSMKMAIKEEWGEEAANLINDLL